MSTIFLDNVIQPPLTNPSGSIVLFPVAADYGVGLWNAELICNISFVSRCSVHIHPEPFLPLSRGDTRPRLLHGHRHVQPRLHPCRALYRFPALPWRERGRTVGLYHGNPRSSTRPSPWEGQTSQNILWSVDSFQLAILLPARKGGERREKEEGREREVRSERREPSIKL